MDVQIGQGVFKRAAKINVVPSIDAWGQAGLHANFTGADFVCSARAPDYFFDREKVSFLGQMAAAECAEAASLHAHVREVDIAIDHIGYDVTHGLNAQMIGRSGHGQKIRTVGIEKSRGFFHGDISSRKRAIEYAARVPEATLGLVEVRPVMDLKEFEM